MIEENFAAEGYAAVSVFEPAQVIAAQADITDHIDRAAHALPLPFEHSRPDMPFYKRLDSVAEMDAVYANRLRVAVCSDAHRGARLTALAQSKILSDTAARLAGRPLGGAIVRARASIAAFPHERHDWHSDVAIADDTDCGRVCVTAWLPLMDAGPESGGLEIVPGRRDAPLPHIRDAGYRIAEDVLAGMPRLQPVCPAGTVLFLDRYTPHRTLPSNGAARFALVIWFKAA